MMATIVLPFWGVHESFAKESFFWPCFHGPNRDNRSHETNLLDAWPEEGPTLLWQTSGIGHGYSSVAVTDRHIFTAGMIEKDTHLVALDLDGHILWQRLVGESWQASDRQRWAVPYAGSRATPTVDRETVYFLSELGKLVAFDINQGDERWSIDISGTWEADRSKYGYSESVFILEDLLFCCPGGKKGYVVALDKNSGTLVWTNTTTKDSIGYSSFILANISGATQLINLTSSQIFAIRPNDGTLLWQYPFGNPRGNNATDVVVSNGLVYGSSGYGRGSILLRPEVSEEHAFTVQKVWESDLLDNHHGSVVLVDQHLYGAGHQAKGWFCLEFLTGKECWRHPGKGTLTYADGHLYCIEEKGLITLVQADSSRWIEKSNFLLPQEGKGDFWAHPVVCDGRLYIRYSDRLYTYDIRKVNEES